MDQCLARVHSIMHAITLFSRYLAAPVYAEVPTCSNILLNETNDLTSLRGLTGKGLQSASKGGNEERN
jgi:hypothetical protein